LIDVRSTHRWALALSIVLVVGCAKIESPSGGPLDKDVPYVQAIAPDSGAVNVRTDLDSLVIVFSERMNRKSVESAFLVTPSLSYRRQTWEEERWILELRDSLRVGQTYVGFLGAEAEDRRKNPLGTPYTFVFATGDSLDNGIIEGQVVGRRFSPRTQSVYLWDWDLGHPDTTEASYPVEPIRISQADKDGAFRFDFVPRTGRYRVCCLFDRDGDGQFQPLPDRWACLPTAVEIPDTTDRVVDLEIFLAAAEETGTVAGAVIDSSCIALDYRLRLETLRAERDSLLEWLEGQRASRRRGMGRITNGDSLRIEREFARFAADEEMALVDSSRCAQPIQVLLIARSVVDADSVVREHSGGAEFLWSDVEPGIYRLKGFRDVDGDGQQGEPEPAGAFQFPIEVLPLRVLEDLDFVLSVDSKRDEE